MMWRKDLEGSMLRMCVVVVDAARWVPIWRFLRRFAWCQYGIRVVAMSNVPSQLASIRAIRGVSLTWAFGPGIL
ncbi:MAG: hypothetical protein P8J37_18600 [Fuerstiella sp.]|nr:hypothetical protein [Fuerstiella sp.]